jgi:Na+-translocating ferredoxin:NAD+ oxidoreductase RnfC subunit
MKDATSSSPYQPRKRFGACQTCGRQVHLTFHHLIPKKMHRRTYFKKHFDKAGLSAGINICRKCHTGIHKTYCEMTLAKQFYTLEMILNDEKLTTHFAWVKKQKTK